jgi:hypothetical protein
MASRPTTASRKQMLGTAILGCPFERSSITPSSTFPFGLVLDSVSAVSRVVIREPRVSRRRRTRLSHSALRRSRRRQLPATGIRPSKLCDRWIPVTLLKRLWNRWCCRFRVNRTAHDLLLNKNVRRAVLHPNVGTATSAVHRAQLDSFSKQPTCSPHEKRPPALADGPRGPAPNSNESPKP